MLMISEKQVTKQWAQYYLNFIRKKGWKDKYQNSGYFWEVGFWGYVLAFIILFLLLF